MLKKPEETRESVVNEEDMCQTPNGMNKLSAPFRRVNLPRPGKDMLQSKLVIPDQSNTHEYVIIARHRNPSLDPPPNRKPMTEASTLC